MRLFGKRRRAERDAWMRAYYVAYVQRQRLLEEPSLTRSLKRDIARIGLLGPRETR